MGNAPQALRNTAAMQEVGAESVMLLLPLGSVRKVAAASAFSLKVSFLSPFTGPLSRSLFLGQAWTSALLVRRWLVALVWCGVLEALTFFTECPSTGVRDYDAEVFGRPLERRYMGACGGGQRKTGQRSRELNMCLDVHLPAGCSFFAGVLEALAFFTECPSTGVQEMLGCLVDRSRGVASAFWKP